MGDTPKPIPGSLYGEFTPITVSSGSQPIKEGAGPLRWWLHETPDGRMWRIDDFGGPTVKVTDIHHPTGRSEWINRKTLTEAPPHV